MEMFDDRALSFWRLWMEEETKYARSKFGDDAQRSYFRQGVANGDYSFASSVGSYARNAVLTRPVLEDKGKLPEAAKMEVVRNFGKCAHNQIACLVTAKDVFGVKAETVDSIYNEAFSDLAFGLAATGFDRARAELYLNLSHVLVEGVEETFEHLQVLQNLGNTADFLKLLSVSALRYSAGFITVSEEFGWVKPGVGRDTLPEAWSLSALV